MRDCTYEFLRSLGVGSWLSGFAPLGDAIDRVLDMGYGENQVVLADLCLELSDKYGVKPTAVNIRMQRVLEIAWRNNTETKRFLESIMQLPLDRQPSVKKFVYAAADYLRSSAME